MKKLLSRFIHEKTGATAVIVALSMVVLLGFTGLVIDSGRLFTVKAKLQKAADAAVLSGGMALPSQPDQAKQDAITTSTENGVATGHTLATISDNSTQIEVDTNEAVPYTFARALGFTSSTVTANAILKVGTLTSYQGSDVIPIGIDVANPDFTSIITNPDFSNNPDFSSLTGDVIELKWGDSLSGDFGGLDFGSGGSGFRAGFTQGSPTPITVGGPLYVENGSMAGPTSQGLDDRFGTDTWNPDDTSLADIEAHIKAEPDCPRVVLVPIYDPTKVPTGYPTKTNTKLTTVVGFATMFITDYQNKTSDKYVKGVFLHESFPGSVSDTETNYGTYGYEIIK